MPLHGKFGNLTLAGTALANLQTVDLTRVSDVADISSMGTDWAEFFAGLTDFTVTAEGKTPLGLNTLDLLGVASGSESEIALQADGSDNSKYTGKAILQSFTETATVDDVISISYQIEGNDESGLTFAGIGATQGSAPSDIIHGKSLDAEISVGTSFSDIRGWTVTGSVPLSDVTVAHASNKGRLKIAGQKTVTATVTILTPLTEVTVDIGETVAVLQLWRKDSTAAHGYYTGAAICTNITHGMSTTSEEVTVFSFNYTGEVNLVIT